MSELKIEYTDPDKLLPNSFNVNTVSAENEAKIDASLKRFGFFKPLLVRTTGFGLEIIGGEHRWGSAKRLGIKSVPYLNLGRISDERAKEISLVDNGRYGTDDTLKLAGLLDELGVNTDELASFMPYSNVELQSIFSSVSIDLDELELSHEDKRLPDPVANVQTHQILRFKVPIEDAQRISDRIKKVMKTQRLVDSDELTNAGDALIYMLGEKDAM